MQEHIATNDVFLNLILLLRLTKEKDYIIELFESQGFNDVTKSKIKAWSTKSGMPAFRPMPEKYLRGFLSALHEAKLINE